MRGWKYVLLALTAPVALALPSAAAAEPMLVSEHVSSIERSISALQVDEPSRLTPEEGPLTQSGAIKAKRERLEALYAAPVQRQVRIEQRVVIRVAPQSRAPRSSLMAEQSRRLTPPRYIEQKMDDCVAVRAIAGVRPGSGNRLVLFFHDRRMVSARLDKSCRARDFYSGFYVERNEDGKLCIARDKLQSRSGANCELTRMRELVEVRD